MKTFQSPEGGTYYTGRPFQYNNRQYASGVATESLFTQLGFTQVTDPVVAEYDARYYYLYPGETTVRARDLAEVKAERIRSVKSLAFDLLRGLDWLIVRNVEDQTQAVPAAVATFRADVRSAANTYETNITNAADLDAVIAVADAAFPSTAAVSEYLF